jgi:F-type H+-transporting ATPase subunit b
MKRFFVSLWISLPLWSSAVLLASEEGGHSEHGGAIEVPFNVWFQFVNLAILVYVLYRAARQPARDFFLKRADGIREALERSETARKEAEAKLKEYEVRMSGLEAEIRNFKEESEAATRAESERIIASANASATRLETDTRRLLNDELARARFQLRQEAIELAVQLAQQLMTQRMTDADQRRLAEDYLKRMSRTTEMN